MAQSDYFIDGTVTPAQLRSELNLILESIATNNSGPAEPAATFPLMFWGDTLAGLLKIRNAGDSAWVVLGRLDREGLDMHLLRRLLFRLSTPLPGSDTTTAQNIFGVGVSLEASTVYEFEALIRLQKTAGTASHGVSLIFGGTASQNPAYNVSVETGGVGSIPAANAWITSGSSAVITSIASATVNITLRARGTIVVSTAGTLVPQYQLSTAPGGAYTVQAGSFMSLLPVGSSAAGHLNLGGWT